MSMKPNCYRGSDLNRILRYAQIIDVDRVGLAKGPYWVFVRSSGLKTGGAELACDCGQKTVLIR